MSYKQRLDTVIAQRGRLCVGIDPMPEVVDAWGQEHTVEGLEACARGIVESLADSVPVFKPQSAFFEAFGSRGIAVLERVLEDVRQAGAMSILDVKRGDIGSSMAGYAAAYLADDAPLAADAVTLNPFLGFGTFAGAIALAARHGRGIYALARTSNPESVSTQRAIQNNSSVSQLIVNEAATANRVHGNCVGLVIGGTHDDLGCDVTGFSGSILVPGIGAQGGSMEQLRTRFAGVLANVLPTASRSIIGAGPDQVAARAKKTLDQAGTLLTPRVG